MTAAVVVVVVTSIQRVLHAVFRENDNENERLSSVARCHSFDSASSEEGPFADYVTKFFAFKKLGENGAPESFQGGLVEGIPGRLVGRSLGHDGGHE